MSHPLHDAHEVHEFGKVVEHARDLFSAMDSRSELTPSECFIRLGRVLAAKGDRDAIMAENLKRPDKPGRMWE